MILTSFFVLQLKSILPLFSRIHPRTCVMSSICFHVFVPSPQGQSEPTSKSKQLFNKAMKEGHVKSHNTVTVFVGAAGTGKTCTKHVLIICIRYQCTWTTYVAIFMSRPFTHFIDSGALISKQQALIRWKLRISRSRQKSLRQETRVCKQGW